MKSYHVNEPAPAETSEMEEFKPIPNLNIPGLTETRCFKRKGENVLCVVAKPTDTKSKRRCPYCGETDCYQHGSNDLRRVHDTPIGEFDIEIYLQTPRFKCMNCGKTFSYPYDFVEQNSTISKRLLNRIKKRALDEPFKRVAKDYGLSDRTIGSILRDYGEELEKNHEFVAPTVLGIDEVHLDKRARGVLTDIERGTIIDLTENRKKETMEAAITALKGYENIKVVTMDMTGGYKGVVETVLPQAVIIVDKYHVIQNLYRAVASSRKALYEAEKDAVAALPPGKVKEDRLELLRRLGKNTYLFRFSRKKLMEAPYRASLMAEVCSTFPKFNVLRTLKESAEDIYLSETSAEASQRIEDWINSVPSDKGFEDFISLAGMFRRWKKEIIAYFDHGKFTNAATEGINSLISHLHNQGRGYSFETLRIKILFNSKTKVAGKTTSRSKPSIPKDALGYFGHFRPEKDTSQADIAKLVEAIKQGNLL